ncbi:LuxR C-terminal-related transcriptional regulator [Pantoea ananatis]|jgi:DNA-binding CsgD family transcriptional regulator|uniref:LuxR C-terminal-related transcriptional regulator n=1 Tax=Pantoea ananas TaxID=553 RepID=UPI000907D154|nr:LuxR C-terminal-related transcriptional regulator [Pantoea ananatis]MCW0306098.1 hypothetical protein [Pantoea ananatis]MCW0332703.1 hypothetical protein [Pantoea ananatis]MCW0337803.1 hypothetical protein [Pantoea ananatis]MCW0356402.1 hypothetical protein [Pantoea ananatis]MCW0360456.1 hypothetical protein [Pantoea ananatis]
MELTDREGNSITLSDNEVAILWFLITGMTSRRMSYWLDMPEKLVSYYKIRAMKKVKVKNNVELLMWFTENRHRSEERHTEPETGCSWKVAPATAIIHINSTAEGCLDKSTGVKLTGKGHTCPE